MNGLASQSWILDHRPVKSSLTSDQQEVVQAEILLFCSDCAITGAVSTKVSKSSLPVILLFS